MRLFPQWKGKDGGGRGARCSDYQPEPKCRVVIKTHACVYVARRVGWGEIGHQGDTVEHLHTHTHTDLSLSRPSAEGIFISKIA